MNEWVKVERNYPHCTILTLNRPDKRNALTINLMNCLCEQIEEAQEIANQRAIIIKGAGPVFCAGMDLSEAMDESLEEASSKIIGRLMRTVYECPLITIAVVHGASLAGGAGLMCTCDLALAETNTLFGFPEIRRGLVAAQIMPYIKQLIPRRLLHEMIFLGETIDVHRAYEIGLINKISPANGGLTDALKYVEKIIKGAPKATKKAKRYIQMLDSLDFYEGLRAGLELHRQMRQEKESKEGMRAFLEKRLPHWG